jgi:transcriptional regulator with XRE-family HTH domain
VSTTAPKERPPYPVVVATNVYRLRKARNWSQEKLARRAELSSDTIGVIENGRDPAKGQNALRLDTLVAIAEALSLEGGPVTPKDLLDWSEEASRVKLPGKHLSMSPSPRSRDRTHRKTYVDSPVVAVAR